jgi:cell division protein FtsQ
VIVAKKKNSFKRKPENKPKRKIGRYVLLLILMAPLMYQAKQIDFARFVPRFEVDEKIQITNVIIQGELIYTDKVTLQRDIEARLGDDFVRTDLVGIQQATIDIPWVKAASVSRVWPSSIKIEIEEQQPIARWGKNGFLNRYGEIIHVEDLSPLAHLPELSGPNDAAADIASEYLTFAMLMAEQELYVSALDVSKSGEWNVEVNRQFGITLGKHDLSLRLERFLYLFDDQLSQRQTDIDHVDMRYKKGLAVKWKEVNDFDQNRESKLVSR